MKQDQTHQTYEAIATKYAENVADLHPKEEANQFLTFLELGSKIIDLGCGSGRDVKIFSEKGYTVVGVDFSPKMIELAKAVAPFAEFHIMDLEQLDFPDETFDGAWANASLLHIKKAKIPKVLRRVYKILKPKGYFFLRMKLGEGEKIEKDSRYGGLEKYWSYFQVGELDPALKMAGFTIVEQFLNDIHSSYQTHPYINLLCQK